MADPIEKPRQERDPIDQIAERWAACEGFLSPRVSTTEEDTDLEYRGRAGKWTLATVFDTDNPIGQAWLEAFLNAREDVEVLLTDVRRLRESTRSANETLGWTRDFYNGR